MKYTEKGLIALTTVQLDLTPEEEKKVKEVFAKEGQTLEEGLKSLVYLLISSNDSKTKFPKMVKPKHKPLRLTNNNDGTFSLPEDTPEYIKELHRLG